MKKLIVALIIVFVIAGWGNTFYKQHKANELLSEISKTPLREIKAIKFRKPSVGTWISLQNVPEEIISSLFSALSGSESALGMRSVSPNTNVVIRIETDLRTFDFDFLYHKQEGKWIKFTLVNRSYFGSNSFTQEHYGHFKSKQLVEFLRYVDNES